MTILKAELRRGAKALILWTVVIGFLLGICILIYPEMESQMNEISGMFSEMGSFSAAFGMDRVNFGEFMGFFAVECGNVLGLGGALFGALLGIGALAGEEKEGTAEFLLTHPVSRRSVLLQKLGAVLLQILILNGAVLEEYSMVGAGSLAFPLYLRFWWGKLPREKPLCFCFWLI